jgi:FAD/FMN-containing dehydrogenase
MPDVQTPLVRGADGYFHPATEADLQALVAVAYAQGTPLRVRGSGHSFPSAAIYTDGYDGTGAPPPNAIEVMLDEYRAVTITPDVNDPSFAIVEVEAGCNLGKNPYDPTHTSTWENSLNFQLQKAGYSLADMGGISHQTISGFMSTGSSGGSLTHSFEENLIGIRLIDGTGRIWDLAVDDPDPAKRDMFCAAGVSLGLLGVLSRVRLRVGRDFNLFGNQATAAFADAGIDFTGTNDGTPTIDQFLQQAPYTRLMWWPQQGLDRMQIWQASRMQPTPQFRPQPYEEIGRYAQIESLAGSLVSTLIGNLDDLAAVPAKLGNWYQHLDATLAGEPDPNACILPGIAAARGVRSKSDVATLVAKILGGALGKHASANASTAAIAPNSVSTATAVDTDVDRAIAQLRTLDLAQPMLAQPLQTPMVGGLPGWLAALLTQVIEAILNGVLSSAQAQIVGQALALAMPYIAGDIVSFFVTDGTQWFWESSRCGLPMDNQMDDQLWPTNFTELWIPFEHTTEAMQRLANFYAAGGDAKLAYSRTGFFSCELYAASKSKFWLSPAYGTDVFRVDLLWFALNAQTPESYYQQFWDLLRDLDYRPHWGKYLPAPGYYLANLPKLADFLALRATLDPKGIFLTQYWKTQLGIA